METILGVFKFLQWPKNESMQVLIGPAFSKNAGPAALACGQRGVIQVAQIADLKIFVRSMNNQFIHY